MADDPKEQLRNFWGVGKPTHAGGGYGWWDKNPHAAHADEGTPVTDGKAATALAESPKSINRVVPSIISEDVTSDASFQRYKQREIIINKRTDFFNQLNRYIGLAATGLGTLTVLSLAAATGVASMIGVSATSVAASALLPLAASALVAIGAHMAISQYVVHMNTDKNTDNTDWYQRRNTELIGKSVAKALAEEGIGATHDAPAKRWSETVNRNTKVSLEKPLELSSWKERESSRASEREKVLHSAAV